MKAQVIAKADGTTSVCVGATVARSAPGIYAVMPQFVCPKGRRVVTPHLLWNGGVTNNLVIQECPDYSTDTTVVLMVSDRGNPAVMVDAAFSVTVEVIP